MSYNYINLTGQNKTIYIKRGMDMPKVGMEPIRRSAIINSTLECICSEGIEKISLEMVAIGANCSKGVVSYYFKNKDNLILESFRAFLSYYKMKIANQIRENMTPNEMLGVVQENALPEYYNLSEEPEEKINVSEIYGIESINIPPKKKAKLFINFFSRAMLDMNLQSLIQEVYKQDFNGISSIIRYGCKEGSFRETNIPESTYAIMSSYIGICMLRVLGFKPDEIKDDRDVFWKIVNSMFNRRDI
jgi:TetR/AcrR family transcriptional repressor of bet genes